MADRRTSRRLLLGLGLDRDGHARVTKGEDFVLVGGTEATHRTMQEDVERFRDELGRMGTDLQRASSREVREAARKSGFARARRR